MGDTGDWDLTGLDTRKFEHLVQALAIEAIGADVTPFGDGPDGGREATFEGAMHYPSYVQSWDGYLVIQCKFQQKPAGTKEQGKWALGQLKADLEKFADPQRKLRKPDYYLFVTNVVLTPAPGTGSQDKIFELLDSYQEKLGLKDYGVWDYGKLCRLLDANPFIRQTYAGSITPGDVLTLMKEQAEGIGESFWHLMPLFVQSEFVKDLYARLEQFIEGGDRAIPLANVFVDLPAFEQYQSEPPDEIASDRLVPGVITELLMAGAEELKGSMLSARDAPPQTDSPSAPEPGRFVVVGGPGQGKSTLGQFLCQLYRGAILRDIVTKNKYALEQDAAAGLRMLERACAASRIALPRTRRFPVRIVLDRFANALADQKTRSLLEYIASRVSRPETPCDANDLRNWLKGHAWLLVLDGLDEVPATSNRKEVVNQVAEFWREVRALDADVLLVATTRPQGYTGDFPKTVYQHRYLAPLSPGRALVYASRLVESRYADPDQAQRVLRRLTQACNHDATARLMRSPLQVTIMAALVESRGQTPQDRWSLFKQYYDVFCNREAEKETPTSRVLRERRQDVDAIHRRVGLLLQTESERPGATESRLPMSRFIHVVRSRLSEEGYEGNELETSTDEIINAAVARLVFLVNIDESITFEIRSLQEFMAAEALMDGTDAVIQERLSAIAPSIHWRNVFLFAAGHCFTVRQSLRDTICSVCDQLNEHNNDPLVGATLAGSRLACDILVEGVARLQPKYAHQLLRIAARLMSMPIVDENARLAGAHDRTLDAIFREEAHDRLQRPNLADRLGAWTVVRLLLDKGIAWAEEFAKHNWPNDLPSQIEIMSKSGAGPAVSAWTIDNLSRITGQADPSDVRFVFIGAEAAANADDAMPKWLSASRRILRGESYPDLTSRFLLTEDQAQGVWFRLRSVEDHSGLAPLKDMPTTAPGWWPVVAASRFFNDPSAAILATLLREFSQLQGKPELEFRNLPWYIAFSIPWPLAACLDAYSAGEEFMELASRLERGELGDLPDWRKAEARWRENGFGPTDWGYSAKEGWPLDRYIGTRGFPIGVSLWSHFVSRPDWPAFLTWFDALEGQRERDRAASMIVALLNLFDPGAARAKPTPAQFRTILLSERKPSIPLGILNGIRIDDFNRDWVDAFEDVFRSKGVDIAGSSDFGLMHSSVATALATAYVREPDRTALLRPLAALAIDGAKFDLPATVLQPDAVGPGGDNVIQLYLRLSQGGWKDDDEIQRIVERFTSTENQRLVVELGLRALLTGSQNGGLSSGEAERLGLALHSHLKQKGSTETWQTFAFLSAALAQRQSPLQVPDQWRRLGLPELSAA